VRATAVLPFVENTLLKRSDHRPVVAKRATFPDSLNYHHKHQGLDPLIYSVSTVTAARANASSVFQLFSFLVVCSGMISKGFGFVAFFAGVKVSSQLCQQIQLPHVLDRDPWAMQL